MSTTVVLSIEIHFDKSAEFELSALRNLKEKNPEFIPIIL